MSHTIVENLLDQCTPSLLPPPINHCRCPSASASSGSSPSRPAVREAVPHRLASGFGHGYPRLSSFSNEDKVLRLSTLCYAGISNHASDTESVRLRDLLHRAVVRQWSSASSRCRFSGTPGIRCASGSPRKEPAIPARCSRDGIRWRREYRGRAPARNYRGGVRV